MSDPRTERAHHLIDVGRFDDALVIAAAVLAADPRDNEALLVAAHCHLRLDRPDLAWEHARQASAAEPHAADPLCWMALADLASDVTDRARDEAHRAVRLQPHNLFARVVLVETLLDDRSTTVAARRAAYEALALDPTNSQLHLLCARAHLETGAPPTIYEVATAQRHVDDALRLDPTSREGLALRAAVSAASGRTGAARHDLARAARAAPGDASALGSGVTQLVTWPARMLTALHVVTGLVVAAGWDPARPNTLVFAKLMVVVTLLITVAVGMKVLLDLGRPLGRALAIATTSLGRAWVVALLSVPIGLYAATALSHSLGTVFAWLVTAAAVAAAVGSWRARRPE